MAISVVLADDEPIILKGLTKLIPWDQHGMEIAGYAYDGKELFEAIETYKPDVVISDINMPYFSGIDIIREIKRRQLPIKVVFISAYQEFAYARDAVAYGAVDYLVKPVKKTELEAVIKKTLGQISEENEEGRIRDKLNLLERKNRDDEVGGWLAQLAEGTFSEQSEGYPYLLEKLDDSLYTIGILGIDPLGNDSERWPAQTQKLVEFAIHNIVQESLGLYGKGYSFIQNGAHIFVLNHTSEDVPLRLADAIRRNIADYLKLKVSVGVGEPAETLFGLKQSGDQAKRALEMTYYEGLNRVIPYRKLEQRKDSENEWFTLQSGIIKSLTGGDWSGAKASMQTLLRLIESATIGNRQLAVSTCFSSMLFIVQEVKKADVPMSDLGFDIQHLQGRLETYVTYKDLCDGIYDMLLELYNRIGDKPGIKEQTLIARIAAYIDEHYREDISLESVAGIAFMNPYYFSSFFKKHMKRNFKQYVTDLRMKQAMELLTHTDMMIYEIAEQVGYNNARHFSDMFKKQTGKLPQEYKQALRQ
ncbi:response regulator [Paenibacillus agaridevorans]|uniref:response regulator n=1 Tax=Paenibacillus agaridevorans TaxID=171404 RepID=UPI001BE45F55|nr:response regulator [Paenibacillus agaridevorans]